MFEQFKKVGRMPFYFEKIHKKGKNERFQEYVEQNISRLPAKSFKISTIKKLNQRKANLKKFSSLDKGNLDSVLFVFN